MAIPRSRRLTHLEITRGATPRSLLSFLRWQDPDPVGRPVEMDLGPLREMRARARHMRHDAQAALERDRIANRLAEEDGFGDPAVEHAARIAIGDVDILGRQHAADA